MGGSRGINYALSARIYRNELGVLERMASDNGATGLRLPCSPDDRLVISSTKPSGSHGWHKSWNHSLDYVCYQLLGLSMKRAHSLVVAVPEILEEIPARSGKSQEDRHDAQDALVGNA